MTPSGSDNRMQTGQLRRKCESCRIICFAAEKGLLKISYHCNSDFFYFFVRKDARHGSFASTNHFSSSLNRKTLMPTDHDRITNSAAAHFRGSSPALMLHSVDFIHPSVNPPNQTRTDISLRIHIQFTGTLILFYISVPTYSTLLCKPANVLTF